MGWSGPSRPPTAQASRKPCLSMRFFHSSVTWPCGEACWSGWYFLVSTQPFGRPSPSLLTWKGRSVPRIMCVSPLCLCTWEWTRSLCLVTVSFRKACCHLPASELNSRGTNSSAAGRGCLVHGSGMRHLSTVKNVTLSPLTYAVCHISLVMCWLCATLFVIVYRIGVVLRPSWSKCVLITGSVSSVWLLNC